MLSDVVPFWDDSFLHLSAYAFGRGLCCHLVICPALSLLISLLPSGSCPFDGVVADVFPPMSGDAMRGFIFRRSMAMCAALFSAGLWRCALLYFPPVFGDVRRYTFRQSMAMLCAVFSANPWR